MKFLKWLMNRAFQREHWKMQKKELGIRAKKINNSWYWELDAVKQR